MNKRLIALLGTLALLLGVLGFTSPTATSATPSTLQPGQLLNRVIYCVAPRTNVSTYTTKGYNEAVGDASFFGLIVRKMQNNSCAAWAGKGLITGEAVYGGSTAVVIPPETPEVPNISPPPTDVPELAPLGYICVKNAGNGLFYPFNNEGASSAAELTGKYVRPFPQNVNGCDSYNYPLTIREWEAIYNPNPIVYTMTMDSYPSWFVQGTSGTYDNPEEEFGGENYRDPVPPVAPALHGCRGKYRLQASNWSTDFEYLYFDLIVGARQAGVRLSASTTYWYCPNKDWPDMVKPLSTTYIVTHLQSVPRPYIRTDFTAGFSDVNTWHMPPTVGLSRSGDARQTTVTVNYPTDRQRWFQIGQNAQWGVNAIMKLQDPSIDPDFNLRTDNGILRKRFFPESDEILGNWVNFYG